MPAPIKKESSTYEIVGENPGVRYRRMTTLPQRSPKDIDPKVLCKAFKNSIFYLECQAKILAGQAGIAPQSLQDTTPVPRRDQEMECKLNLMGDGLICSPR
jgi:hypothetical protein